MFKGGVDAVFCTAAHKDAFHNRQAKRGKIMMPLILAWRGGRGQKDVSKWAWAQVAALADKWNAEDKAAGRTPMINYVVPKMRRNWSAADA